MDTYLARTVWNHNNSVFIKNTLKNYYGAGYLLRCTDQMITKSVCEFSRKHFR